MEYLVNLHAHHKSNIVAVARFASLKPEAMIMSGIVA